MFEDIFVAGLTGVAFAAFVIFMLTRPGNEPAKRIRPEEGRRRSNRDS